MNFKSIINDIRNNYRDKPKNKFKLRYYPWVMNTELKSIYNDNEYLAKHGKIVFAYLIQANNEIFKRKVFGFDVPGCLLYSTDPYYEDHPEELEALAKQIYQYKGRKDAPEEIRKFVEHITNEYSYEQNQKLPKSITPNGDVYYSVFMIWRKHLIDKHLKVSIFPIFADPNVVKSCMIVPKEYWSNDYIKYFNHLISSKQLINSKDENEEYQKKLVEDKAVNRIKISYNTHEKVTILGKSKIGGFPHAPKDFSWPKSEDGYLNFLCEINLSEVAKYDLLNKLPKNGILLVFYDMNKMVWGIEPKDMNYYKVIYIKEYDELTEITSPKTNLDIYHESPISFKSEANYPITDGIDGVDFELIEKLYRDKLDETQEMNQLLGYPFNIQGSMEDDFNNMYFMINNKKSQSHKLLLQLGNFNDPIYDNLMFGDCGNIYFFIDNEDLEQENFDKVILFLQCY